MERRVVERAIAAASSLARDLDLPVDDAVVVRNSNALALRLLPSDVFARTALVGQEVAEFEISVAQALAFTPAPVVTLDPRIEPRVYTRDGFAVTFWQHHHRAGDAASPSDYADALRRLHRAMRDVTVEAPSFEERVATAERLLTNRHQTPALLETDRTLLLDTLRDALRNILGRARAHQLLHGEPHPGNVLPTPAGLLFVDLETCCVGPLEFDVAHVPDDVSALYPGVDLDLLLECRRLVLAMVGTWRWDRHDEFPNGHRHAIDILDLLRAGPPWPPLGVLATG